MSNSGDNDKEESNVEQLAGMAVSGIYFYLWFVGVCLGLIAAMFLGLFFSAYFGIL